MKKRNQEILQKLLVEMLEKFRDEFFKKHLESIEIKASEEDANIITLNLLMSFANSSFLNIVLPILTSTENKEKAMEDAEKLLSDLRIAIMTNLKGHTPIGKIIN